MLKPYMASPLPDYGVSDLLQRADQTVAGHPAATSCSFQGSQLVFNVVHLDQPRTHRGVFKVQRNCLDHVGPQFIPVVSFGENAGAQCASVEATVLRIANLEDQLHESKLPERVGRPKAIIGVRSQQGRLRMAKKQYGKWGRRVRRRCCGCLTSTRPNQRY